MTHCRHGYGAQTNNIRLSFQVSLSYFSLLLDSFSLLFCVLARVSLKLFLALFLLMIMSVQTPTCAHVWMCGSRSLSFPSSNACLELNANIYCLFFLLRPPLYLTFARFFLRCSIQMLRVLPSVSLIHFVTHVPPTCCTLPRTLVELLAAFPPGPIFCFLLSSPFVSACTPALILSL